MRTLICKFCSQGKTAKEMSDHETYCGSRTERCDRCPDWVQLKEWDSHQNRYHANVHRRFRERSVIAQTETIIEYNAGERKKISWNRNVLKCQIFFGTTLSFQPCALFIASSFKLIKNGLSFKGQVLWFSLFSLESSKKLGIHFCTYIGKIGLWWRESYCY